MDITTIEHYILTKSPKSMHWVNRYLNFIRYLLDHPYTGKTVHRHHILPSSMYPEFKTKPWNIIHISPKMHLTLHRILHHCFGGSMTSAYFQMCIHPKYDIPVTSSQYKTISKKFSDDMRSRRFYRIDGNLRRLSPTHHLVKRSGVTPITPWEWLKEYLNIHSSGRTLVFDTKLNRNVMTLVTDIDYDRYIPLGLLRDKESRQKTSEALGDRFHCYNPENFNERKFLKNGEPKPNGWELGLSPDFKREQSVRLTGMKHYHNPNTGEQRRFDDKSKVPDGWVPGRRKFNNPFKGKKILHNPFTGEVRAFKKSELPDRYFCPHACNVFYTYQVTDREIVFTYSPEKIANLSGMALGSIKDKRDDYVFSARKFKGKSMRDIGIRKIPISEWDTENDSQYKWI